MSLTLYRLDQNYVIIDSRYSKEYFLPAGQVGIIKNSSTELEVNYDPISKSHLNWGGLASEVLDSNGTAYGTTVDEVIAGLNTGSDVNIQDQITEPIDTFFLQQLSSFTLASDAAASGKTTFNQQFTATTGHGIIVGSEINLLDVAADRQFYARVTAVAGDVITIDRPIDNDFEAASTIGQIVVHDMAVDGSITPQIFTIRAGTTPIDITRIFISFLSSNSMDDGKFGSLTALTNGIVLRYHNGTQKTIFNFKTNAEIKQFCYDLNYASKAAAGTYGAIARISFNGQDKHGVAIRLSGTDVLQWIVQDDLTGLDALSCTAQGHKTENEI